uniref:Protein kinase domain-containing protein n=1 Tax=Plectus sambesii TaxID=2011161 RepID=A0A914V118_9BILA
PATYPDLPQEIEGYHHLVPLEPPKPIGVVERNFFGAYMSSVYKAIGTKDGLPYCLRRLHNSRLAHQKSLTMVDLWKKLVHAHVVQLREVFSTKHFGDYSLMFIYDYHPLAETLKMRHFSSQQTRMANGNHSLLDDGRSPSGTGAGGPPKFAINNGAAGGSASGGLPESLIWTYVVQLSSALRAIHAAGMAARTMDPSKILIFGKSKLMINCCGIVDVLTFDANHPNMMALIQHQQQEDLVGLGRLVVALACGTLQAAMR